MGVVAPVVALALGDCFYPCIGHPTVNMARMSYTPRGTLSRHGHPLTAFGQRGIFIEGTPSMRSFYLVGLRCRPARWIGEPLCSLPRSNGNRLVGLVCDGAGLDTGYCYLPSYVAVQQ